jgi:hypothetical protein
VSIRAPSLSLRPPQLFRSAGTVSPRHQDPRRPHLSATQRVWLYGGLGVVVFDAIASVLSRQLGFAYTTAAWGSYVLYVVVGFVAARRGGMSAAIVAGLLVGLVDASAGWAVSWDVGPGHPAGFTLTPLSWCVVAITVAIFAAICGAIGGLGSRLVGPPSATA